MTALLQLILCTLSQLTFFPTFQESSGTYAYKIKRWAVYHLLKKHSMQIPELSSQFLSQQQKLSPQTNKHVPLHLPQYAEEVKILAHICTPQKQPTHEFPPQIHLQDNAGHGGVCKAAFLPLTCTCFKAFKFSFFFFSFKQCHLSTSHRIADNKTEEEFLLCKGCNP